MNISTHIGGRVKAGLAIAAAALSLSLAGWNLSNPTAEAASANRPSAVATTPAPGARTVATRDSYADLVAEVAPAVVTIRSERRVREAVQFPFDDTNPMFRRFFGDRMPSERRQVPREEGALGSGVIVRNDGYILTNEHVVDGAEHTQVELPDHRTFDAKLVGSDKPSDLAVLKIDARDLPTMRLGNSDQLRVGDVVLASGNPMGIGQTVTLGIVSAKGRATGIGDGGFQDFIQTDAPINHGNSGGALVDTRGELVGINSEILSTTGANMGIGFSIPANMAENVMDQLIASGRVRRGMLGVTVQAVTSDIASSLGLNEVRGAIVSNVEAGSPAARAGLQQGDVILTLNGQPVNDSNGLRNRVAGAMPGTKVTLSVMRNGHEQTMSAVLGELPGSRRTAAAPAAEGDRGRFGLSVEPVTPEAARELGLKDLHGVVVDQVAAGSAASEAGIQPGDVIEQVNRKPVNSVGDLQAALENAGVRPALLLVNRQGTDLFVALAGKRS